MAVFLPMFAAALASSAPAPAPVPVPVPVPVPDQDAYAVPAAYTTCVEEYGRERRGPADVRYDSAVFEGALEACGESAGLADLPLSTPAHAAATVRIYVHTRDTLDALPPPPEPDGPPPIRTVPLRVGQADSFRGGAIDRATAVSLGVLRYPWMVCAKENFGAIEDPGRLSAWQAAFDTAARACAERRALADAEVARRLEAQGHAARDIAEASSRGWEAALMMMLMGIVRERGYDYADMPRPQGYGADGRSLRMPPPGGGPRR